MRVCLFADVHGNLPALETLLRLTRAEADAFVCLGDTVDYGPWNDECLERIRSLPEVTVLEGNHERLFLGIDPIEREPALVQAFHRTSRRWFTRPDLIRDLPESCEVGGFVCRHTIDGRKIYADTEGIEVSAPHVIAHTHHAFDITRSGQRIVNCGSVGQNRARGETLTWASLDTDRGAIRLHEAPYEVDRYQRELAARGYPPECLDYIRRLRARGRAAAPAERPC